jgi:methylated-DNA-[protein]-cysteine S-methyltransferase
MATGSAMRACVRLDSPVGALRVEADAEAVRVVHFVERGEAVTDGGAAVPAAARRLAEKAATELAEYFRGERQSFTVKVRPRGTKFQERVWAALRRIPFGATRSYGDIARAIGQPAAVRAVGGANNRNPVAIVIPCHRVIGSDGKLVGYGGGLDHKAWLLNHESRESGARGHARKARAHAQNARSFVRVAARG